jgi:hypothetical protein
MNFKSFCSYLQNKCVAIHFDSPKTRDVTRLVACCSSSLSTVILDGVFRHAFPRTGSLCTLNIFAVLTDHLQLQKWEQIVVSNPARVVRAIAVSVNRRTREGDTTADIYPALAAIAEAARRETNPNGYDGTEWDSLVEAGVVDQLCKVIDTLTPFNLHAGRDNTPQHVMEAMAKEVRYTTFLLEPASLTHEDLRSRLHTNSPLRSYATL